MQAGGLRPCQNGQDYTLDKETRGKSSTGVNEDGFEVPPNTVYVRETKGVRGKGQGGD